MSKRNHRSRPPKRPYADGLTTLLHWPGASANEPPLLNSSCRSTRPRQVLRIARMELAR